MILLISCFPLRSSYVRIVLWATSVCFASLWVSVVKSIMDIVGLTGGPVRPPLVNVAYEELVELRKMMENWRSFLEPKPVSLKQLQTP